MKICNSYNIPCPWALVINPELPCYVPNQKSCDEWRKKYKKAISDAMSFEKTKGLEEELLDGKKRF